MENQGIPKPVLTCYTGSRFEESSVVRTTIWGGEMITATSHTGSFGPDLPIPHGYQDPKHGAGGHQRLYKGIPVGRQVFTHSTFITTFTNYKPLIESLGISSYLHITMNFLYFLLFLYSVFIATAGIIPLSPTALVKVQLFYLLSCSFGPTVIL